MGQSLNALERLANGYGSECVRVRQDLAIAESQLRDYQARLGKPLLHDAYLSELTDLRDQLKAGLSGAAYESGNEAGSRVTELAERIKALKVAHSIETTPQRVRQKQSTAEEPVTARIRRRTEATPVSAQGIQPDADASGTGAAQLPESTAQAGPGDPAPPATTFDDEGITRDVTIKPQMTFQERIAIERRGIENPERTL